MKFSALAGLARSLLMYYAIPGRAAAWRGFYRRFFIARDLCFDIGAHVGNRTAAMLALGARVVAVEPQPLFARTLKRLYGSNPNFHLVEKAVSSFRGRRELMISHQTPTVSSLSKEWVRQVAPAPAFANVDWDEQFLVDVVTLDALISEYGSPAFCKIDAEGSELEILIGLSQPILTISFEYLPPFADRAVECLDRLSVLGSYRFNLISGEHPRFVFNDWTDSSELTRFLEELTLTERPGEIYARLNALV
ncbi:MAG: FkbM family methyltransferase [Anaerolineales bacterium]